VVLRDAGLQNSEQYSLEAGRWFSFRYERPDSNQVIGIRWDPVVAGLQPYNTETGVPIDGIRSADVQNYRPVTRRPAVVGFRVPITAPEGAGRMAVYLVSGPVEAWIYGMLNSKVDQDSADTAKRDSSDGLVYDREDNSLSMVVAGSIETYRDLRGNCTCILRHDTDTGEWSGSVSVFVGYF
jgi:hypothetical protein